MKTNTLDFDAQALREKILDLAMRGKLVPQDPNDESASVLLEKIKNEKGRLVKEKKIKKSKPLPPITDDEKPFNIPDSWEWVRLGNIADYIQRGRSPKYDKINKKHPIISQKCIQWSGISLKHAKFVTQDFFDRLENYRFVQSNDILWNSTGTGTVGRVINVKKQFDHVPVDSHVTLIRTNRNLNSEFITNYLQSPIIQDNLNDYLSGTTKQKELGRNAVINVVVPVPPLSEQSRIAAKVAQLFALLRKVESSNQQYAKLKILLKEKVLDLAMRGKLVKQDPNDEPASELLKEINAEKDQLIKEKKIKKSKPLPAITDDEKPFDIPDSWEWVRIGEAFNLQAGKNKKSAEIFDKKDNKNIYPCFGGNGIRGYVSDYNRRGNFAIVGRQGALCGNINFAQGKFYATEHAVVVENFAQTSYKWSGYFLRALNLNQYSTATAQPGLAVSKINKVLIPLPPLNEQKRIVAKIEKLFTAIDKQKLTA